MGYPPKSPIRTGIKPSAFILNSFTVALENILERILKDFEVAMYDESTKNGNSDGITVESKSVIPFFMPLLAFSGFIKINVIKKKVHIILGKCKRSVLKFIFKNITTQSNIFYDVPA